MKKFTSAHFALECIIEEGKKAPSYILRDRNGNICTVGSIDDVVSFLQETYDSFIAQKEASQSPEKNS